MPLNPVFDGRELSAMLLTALLLTAQTMTFPLGVVDIPEGCTAPAKVSMFVDGFISGIECGPNFRILLYGDLYMKDTCKGAPPRTRGARAAPDQVVTKGGISLPVCVFKRKKSGSQKETEETLVDLGSGYFSAEIRTPKHLSLLLGIARSFRPGEDGNAK